MKKLFTLIGLLGLVAGMGGALKAQETLDRVYLLGLFAEGSVGKTLKFKFSATPGDKFVVALGQDKDTITAEAEITEFSHTFSRDLKSVSINLSSLNQTSHLHHFEMDSSTDRYRIINFENCPMLKSVHVTHNTFENFTFRNCPALTFLDCSYNEIISLYFWSDSNLYDNLTYLNFSHNDIKAFTATDYGGLETLDCSYNPNLGILRTDDCRALKSLNCSSTLLRELNLSTQILQTLNCGNTQLTSLKLSELPALRTLDCSDNPQLTQLTIQCPSLDTLHMNRNTQLFSLNIYDSRLTGIDLSDNTALIDIVLQNNTMLENLDLSNLSVLEQLTCASSPKLKSLDCSNTQLTFLELSELPALQTLDCSNTKLNYKYLSKLPALRTLNCSNTQLTSLELSELPALQTLDCSNTQLTDLYLIELPELRTLDCSDNLQLTGLTIQCPNLDSLRMHGNTQLTSLHVSYSRLAGLDLSSNTQLTSLSLSELPELQTLDCSDNLQLTSLSLSELPALQTLNCNNTQLTSLGLTELPSLLTLNCSNNLQLTSLTINNACLTSLDISNDTALESLSCHHNQLDKIDLSSNKKLNTLYCSHNQLSSLNLPENLTLVQISCDSNRISSLSVLAALRKQAQHGILSPQFVTATLQVGNVLNLQGEMYIDNRQTDLTLLDSNGNIIENMCDILADHGDGLLYFKNKGQYRLQLYNEFIDQNNSATPLIVYYDLTVVDSVVRPQFSIPSGAVLPDAELILSTPTPDAHIYYTTDGTEPDETALSYTAPIRITEAVTIKAVAIQDTFKSHIAIATYTMDTVARPTFSIPSGAVVWPDTTLVLNTATPNAKIYYTIDGGEPDETALAYTAPIRITEAMTVKAVAVYKTVRSQIATASYTIDSVNNEHDLRASRLRVYAQDRTIHLSETVGEIEVFTMDGHCVYRGHETAIPVKQSGLYVVSANGKFYKTIVQ